MRARTVIASLFVTIPENGATQVALRQPGRELFEVSGKSVNVMEIFAGVFSEVVAGQFPSGPGLVKRVAKQIVFRNACVQLGNKFLGGHFASG
jgi:hypothetical protein